MSDDSARRAINWFELDRLVDGQLAPDEYREMLRQIDKDPDGWRQCAMAFLQYQAMEKEFQKLAVSPESPIDQPAKPKPIPAAHTRQLSRAVTVICGVSVALVLGISAGVTMRPVDDLQNNQAGVVDYKSPMIQPISTDKRSSAAPPPASYSRSSNSLHANLDSVAEEDPHLCASPRCRNQLDSGK